MEFERMKREATKLDVAIDKIKNSNTQDYKWYSVKNKKGIFIEVGGRNYQDKLEIKVYIPKIENGKYLLYQNGWAVTAYSLTNEGEIEYPTFRDNHCLRDDKFLQFINNTDFRIYSPTIEERHEEIIEIYLTAKL